MVIFRWFFCGNSNVKAVYIRFYLRKTTKLEWVDCALDEIAPDEVDSLYDEIISKNRSIIVNYEDYINARVIFPYEDGDLEVY